MERLKINLIILVLLTTACSESEEINIPEEFSEYENIAVFSADSQPAFKISIDRRTVYGDTDDVLLGNRLMITVDNQGRVYIADNQEIALHVYNPDGTYITQIGQTGEGPGEYRMIRNMYADSKYLHLMDLSLNRITRYSLDTFKVEGELSLSRDQGASEGYFRYPHRFYLSDSDTYILQFVTGLSEDENEIDGQRSIEGMTLNYTTSEIIDSTVFSFPSSEALINREGNSIMVMTVPYNRKSVTSVQYGQIIHGWSDRLFLKIYNNSGQYERAIYYPYENIPLDRNEVLKIYSDHEEQWQNMVLGDDMPETWPVFDSFTVDNKGRIWVEKLTEDRNESEYVVLANSGELLATFNWPSDREVQVIKDDYVYTLETNEKTGLMEIVKYGISFEEI